MTPRNLKPGGFRPISELRDRLNSVHQLVDDVRAEPARPIQFPIALILVAILPLGVAFAAIRQASRHDAEGYLLSLAVGGLLCGGAIYGGLSRQGEDSELARFFQAELVLVGLIMTLAGLYFLEH